MARYSSGRFALRISDRDGQAYPYNEMVQEWTGAWVHRSEYEPKSPLLNPTNHPTDAQSLQHAKPQIVSVIVPLSGISDYNADTGLTTDLGAGNGSLDGASNIALELGDFFIVTTDGDDFYATTLEVGDTNYSNKIISANSDICAWSYFLNF